MGNRLFSLSHREVYDLFTDWGWEEGPERGDGHKRMLKTIADITRTVQIMPPDRPGTGERGNAIAIKTAARLMDMTVNQFLNGPRDETARQKRMDRQDRVLKAAEQRVHQQRAAAEAAARTQEVTMAKPAKHNGAMNALHNMMGKYPNQRKNVATWADLFFAHFPEYVGEIDTARVGVYLSQAAKRKTRKRPGDFAVFRTGRGQYVWKQVPEETTPAAPPAPAPVAAPPVESVAVVVEQPAPAVSLNGQTPDLLAKVHVLDGGKYLFQGEDGALYVVSDIVRLNV